MISGFSLLHILFAIIGLGFLVFIHELGHYIVARRRGMKVEAFSIGFGNSTVKIENTFPNFSAMLLILARKLSNRF